jgi:hypothetical protein
MATKNFSPQLWAATVLRTLEDNLIGTKICTTQYTGEIKQKGDSVLFPGLADPTVNSYTGSITYEDLQDAGITLTVDQADYFAFKVGDIDKAQAELDMKGSQAQRAAYQMKRSADTFLMKMYKQAANNLTAATITSANVLSVLGGFQQKLAENNVAENNMWMVINPWLKLKLQLAGIKFQINNGTNGKGGMSWTDELGFDIYVTNQVQVVTNASQVMAGSYNAIAFADQITETENVRLLDSFSDAVRGLHVYGGKVIKPKELVTAALTFGAETTI